MSEDPAVLAVAFVAMRRYRATEEQARRVRALPDLPTEAQKREVDARGWTLLQAACALGLERPASKLLHIAGCDPHFVSRGARG